MKAVMLRSRTVNSNDGVNNNNKNVYKLKKLPSFPPMIFTKAHFHELLTELTSESSLSEQNEVDAPKDELDSESKLLVKSASANAINPGDTRNIISTHDKGKATSNKTQGAFSNDVTINSKKCQ